MPLTRVWRGRPRGLSELPAEIRESPRYDPEGGDWLDRADLSVDGFWIRILLETGRVDYWTRHPETGLWTPTDDRPAWEKFLG